MMTSSNGNIFRVTSHLCGEFTGPRWIPPHKGQWRGALMFSLICVWINDWVNNREAGDLRRYRAHYDVTVRCSASDFHLGGHYCGITLESWYLKSLVTLLFCLQLVQVNKKANIKAPHYWPCSYWEKCTGDHWILLTKSTWYGNCVHVMTLPWCASNSVSLQVVVLSAPQLIKGIWMVAIATTMTSSNGNIFRVTGLLWREFTGDRWIPLNKANKQRVLMHGHQGWNVRHGLCHIYMIYVYIWVVHSFCLFCCLFIIVTTQFVALYEPCKPKPKPKPSTYDTRTTTPWQRSKFRYLDRSQSNKYAINMQIQTISVSK